MPIQEFQIVFPGQSIRPRFGHLRTSDTLAVVTSSGYLNHYMKSQGFSILPGDFIFVWAADGQQIYKPVFNGNIVTLTVLP